MKLLHLVAKTYGARPSEIAGIRNKWTAYQLDTAVLMGVLADDEEGAVAGTADAGDNAAALADLMPFAGR